MEKTKLLIVDDDETIRGQMKWALTDEYDINLAEDGETAIRFFRQEKPCLVTLDLGLPPDPHSSAEGLKILNEILSIAPETKILIISGNTERANALKAVEAGAYDFFTKPIDVAELKIMLRRAYQLYLLEKENMELQRRESGQTLLDMIGECQMMKAVYTKIRKVAPSNVPVLILGESGTGKEIAAQAIHALSERKEGPFVPINCGAIPEHLIESELFGHEKGSFTGAHTQRMGRMEYAHKGTLFLDEIGELGLSMQVKILRFLQDKIIERVGGREPISIDARIIAATNKDLEKEVQAVRFREDLFYRINGVRISLPPLRERDTDILLLANHLFGRFVTQAKKRLKGFSASSHEAMLHHTWPGNVREMENRIRRGVIMTEGEYILPSDLELEEPKEISQNISLREARDKIDREMIIKALAINQGNIKDAARGLGVTRQTLYDLIEKHSIQI